ncbi:MAG: sulfite exporter TauE/SafE family protein [Candidatus Thorarchaeota archaeon]
MIIIETYIIVSLLIFLFTTFLIIGGVGAAFIDTPLLIYFGFDIVMVTALGLLLNIFSTGTASIRHYKQKAIQYDVAYPIILTSLITAPLGAISVNLISKNDLKFLFAIALLVIGLNMLYNLVKTRKTFSKDNQDDLGILTSISLKQRLVISILLGMLVGFITGLLGIGGGTIILPFLLYFGLETKKAAGTTSFIVVFSSLVGFISKITLTHFVIDYLLLFLSVFVTILGAILGSYLMHFKLNKNQIKLIIVIFLEFVAIKMLSDFI